MDLNAQLDGFSGLGEPPVGLTYQQVDHTLIGPDEIQNRFGAHKATIEGPEATAPKHVDLRSAFMNFANHLDHILDDSREKSLAFTELENASMWAHKAIAKNAPIDTNK